jgi:hypothetical protein
MTSQRGLEKASPVTERVNGGTRAVCLLFGLKSLSTFSRIHFVLVITNDVGERMRTEFTRAS